MKQSFKAKLPENLQPNKAERDIVLRLHHEGVLFRVHQFIAERLQDFDTEVDNKGVFWIHDKPLSDNFLWCLLRRDVEAQNFPIPTNVLKKVIDISFAYIRARVPQNLGPSERADIITKDWHDEHRNGPESYQAIGE